MKKPYQKPRVLFEHLELDSAINTCTFMPVTNCQDVTPNDGTEDIPYNVVSTIDGSIETMIYSAFGVCNATEECYHVPSLSGRTLSSLS